MARSHKYIKRLGAPKQYHYIYQDEGKKRPPLTQDMMEKPFDRISDIPVLPMSRAAAIAKKPTKFVIQQPVRSGAWERADKLFKPEGKTFGMFGGKLDKLEADMESKFDKLPQRLKYAPWQTPAKQTEDYKVLMDWKDAKVRYERLKEGKDYREGKTLRMEAPRHIILEGGPNRRLKPEEKARESLKTYSGPHAPLYLDSKAKKNINDMIAPLIKDYHNEIPLKDIFNVLSKHGVVPLQEDNTEWSGLLIGREGHTNFPIAPFGTRSPEKEFEHSYKPFKNANLSLSWYKLESGRYEVLSHVS
jgi:hypothetical protein